MLSQPNVNAKVLCMIPTGGVYCQFITAFQHLSDNLQVFGRVPGDSLDDCYCRWGMDRVSAKPWIKVLCQEMVGWLLLDHLEKVFELDPDHNGDMVEKLVYPYPSDD